MTDSSNRTYTLDPEHLGLAIEVLKRAGESFGLTRRERIGYRALIISGDLGLVSLALLVIIIILTFPSLLRNPSADPEWWMLVPFGLASLMFLVSAVGGALSLLLNFPLFLKTWRERAELKRLGLRNLSKSLWRAGRKHRWLQRVRGALLLFVGAFLLLIFLLTPFALLSKEFSKEFFGDSTRHGMGRGVSTVAVVVVYALPALTMLGARYLRNCREQIALVANAEKLEESLSELRLNAGDGRAIKIPADTLQQVARIESSQIMQERKTAILESVGSERSGYSVSFAREAAEQKSALDRADRIELEDLLEQLSTGMLRGEADVRGTGEVNRVRTASASVEIEYATDEPRRAIHVVAVRRIGDDADRTPGPEEQGHV